MLKSRELIIFKVSSTGRCYDYERNEGKVTYHLHIKHGSFFTTLQSDYLLLKDDDNVLSMGLCDAILSFELFFQRQRD